MSLDRLEEPDEPMTPNQPNEQTELAEAIQQAELYKSKGWMIPQSTVDIFLANCKQVSELREEVNKWKASSESWESTAKLPASSIPRGHPDACCYDKKGDGSWSVIACKMCEQEHQSREMREVIERHIILFNGIHNLCEYRYNQDQLALAQYCMEHCNEALTLAREKGFIKETK